MDPMVSIIAGSAVGIAAVDAVRFVQRILSRSSEES